MKRYLVYGDPEKTPYSDFVGKFKELFHAPDLSRAAMFSLTKTKQRPDERIEQFKVRVERLVSKSYGHLSAQDRDPMAVNTFLVGLHDSRLMDHLLTQRPTTLTDAERIS